MGSRDQEIRRTANDVLAELDITMLPIVPTDIAKAKGIRLDQRSAFPAGVYGAFYQDAAGFGILVSARCHGPGHRAFTIAHELGHYHIEGHVEEMFPHGEGQVPSLGGHFREQKSILEREADCFAAELLAPKAIVGPWVRDLPPTVGNVEKLANDLGLSLSCAGVRYAELTDEATAIVLARGREIEWIAFSPRLREHRWTRKSWRKEWTPPHSATSQLADRPDHVERGELRKSSSLLCEWFDDAPSELVADEECLGLGSYGRTMTILSVQNLPSEEDVDEGNQASEWRERDWRDAVRGYELD